MAWSSRPRGFWKRITTFWFLRTARATLRGLLVIGAGLVTSPILKPAWRAAARPGGGSMASTPTPSTALEKPAASGPGAPAATFLGAAMFCGLFTSLSSKLKSTLARTGVAAGVPGHLAEVEVERHLEAAQDAVLLADEHVHVGLLHDLPDLLVEVGRQVHLGAALARQREEVTDELGGVHGGGHVLGGHAVHLRLALVLDVGEPGARVEAEHAGRRRRSPCANEAICLRDSCKLRPERLGHAVGGVALGEEAAVARATPRRRSRPRPPRRPSAGRRRAASGSWRGSGTRRSPSRRIPGPRRPPG